MNSILFVCMGNICRSPTAEAVFRSKAEQTGVSGSLTIDSAGTHGYHEGCLPDPRARAKARRKGYAMSSLRSRPLCDDDLDRFDLILVMDEANLVHVQGIKDRKGKSSAQIRLFVEFSEKYKLRGEIPDPYYGDDGQFDLVIDMIEDAADGLLRFLKDHDGQD